MCDLGVREAELETVDLLCSSREITSIFFFLSCLSTQITNSVL